MQITNHALIDNLIKLGLTYTESLVFVSLLERGPCFVAPLVALTKKHRQIVYNALDALSRRHLITFSVRRGKRFYAIGDPEKLLTNIRQLELIAEVVVKKIEKKISKGGEKVEIYSGPDSFELGLFDFRKRAEFAGEYTVIGGEPEEWFEFVKPIFNKHVEEVKNLKKLGIPINILFFESERKSALKYIGPLIDNPYILKISSVKPKLPHTVWLAGDHVYFLTPTMEPLVVHINSSALSIQYRIYFEELWNSAELIINNNQNMGA